MTPLLGTFSVGSARGYGRETSAGVAGQQTYTTAGTYTFVVPAGVTSVSVVCVGASKQYSNQTNYGLGGGGLGYKNNITVVPGNSYEVVVSGANDGRGSHFINTSTVLGGQSISNSGGGTFVGDGGGNKEVAGGGGAVVGATVVGAAVVGAAVVWASEQATVVAQNLVQAGQQLTQFSLRVSLFIQCHISGGGRFGRGFKRQVQGRQHRNALTRLDLARVADLAHGGINLVHRRLKLRLAAGGAFEQVALPHDVHFQLLRAHGASFSGKVSGRRSSRASTRARAALSRDLSELRSWVRASTCSLSKALVRCNSSWRSNKRSTRSAT